MGFQALCIFLFLSIWCSTASAQCPSDMTAFWDLNESSGSPYVDTVNGHNATCPETCPTYTPFGRINGGQVFDGETTGISVPSDAVFDWGAGDSFTIEFWMRKLPGTLSGDEAVAGRTEGTTLLNWWIGIDGDGRAAFALTDINGGSITLHGERNLTDGNWHHVVAVRDGDADANLLYVDGQLEASQESAGYQSGFSSPTAPITMGYVEDGSAGRFSGLLDELAIYDRRLTEEEIAAHVLDGLVDYRWGYCDPRPRIRIMPLGDSITQGVTCSEAGTVEDGNLLAGYRQKVDLVLAGLGFDVDFVGGRSAGSSVEPEFDLDHEGHPGLRDDQLAENIYGWLSANPAEIVLLHIGSNDVDEDSGDVEAVLEEIDRFDEEITVLLALVIGRENQTLNDRTRAFNENLAQMAQARIADGDKIVLVDMESALSYPQDLCGDGFHPTPAGYSKMADAWLSGLLRFFSFSPIPTITSRPPATELPMGVAFTYDVSASGRPAPIFRLVDAPEGMTIDERTGLIEWTTPYVAGDYEVTVQAANPEGASNQTFTLTVVNSPPVADAGPDQVAVEGATVTLDGSGSFDPDGGIAAYRWEQISGPAVTLSNPDGINPTFTAPAVDVSGVAFRLTVEDRGGLTDTDETLVTVNAAAAPVADAGPDRTVDKGETVRLDGTGSSDADGAIVSYRWTQTSGAPAALSNAGAADPTFVAPNVGTDGDLLTFTLAVTDNNGLTASDTVEVRVNWVNLAPIAAAGDDLAVTEGETVTLDGAGSRDPDGGILSYQWVQKAGPTVPLSDPEGKTPTFVAPDVDVLGLIFELTVTDKGGLSDTDEVHVAVNDNGIDRFPEGVTTFRTVTGRELGIEVAPGGALVELRTVALETIADAVDRPTSAPYGLLDLAIRTDAPGGTVQVTVHLPEPAPADYRWYRYNALDGWGEYSDHAVFQGGRDRVTLTFADGGIGDDDGNAGPNGEIRSLSGLGVIVSDREEEDGLIDCFIGSSSFF